MPQTGDEKKIRILSKLKKNDPDLHLNGRSYQDPDPRHDILIRATPQLIKLKAGNWRRDFYKKP
jgi:hypothetical protein